jgi:hypothetical protein
MKKILPSVIGVVILTMVVIFMKSIKPIYVSMDEVDYEVEIYDVDKNYSFSLFENREKELLEWRSNNIVLAMACLEGASFILDLSDQELNALFEKPDDNIIKVLRSNAQTLLTKAKNNEGGWSLGMSVRITKVVTAEAGGMKYIIIQMEKTSDNTPVTMTGIMVEIDKSWKCMSGERDPNGDLVHSLNRVAEEVSKMSMSGKIKPIKPDF